MLKASALFIVIIISFLLASITGGIVYYTFYYRIKVADVVMYNRLSHNLNSAIAYTLSLPETSSFDKKQIDLYGESEDSATIQSKVWGVFNVASVTVHGRSSTLEKTFMYGYAPDKESNAAIHLADSDRGLRIAGKTTLVGTCYLPQKVVQSASVDGYLYNGPRKLVDGEIIKSTTDLVPVNPVVISTIKELISTDFLSLPAIPETSEDSLFSNDTLICSFHKQTVYLSYEDERLLDKIYIEGNVVLYSRKALTCRKDLVLKDVIVVAPSVSISKDFKGMVQVFCSDSIIIEPGVVLDYPSALVLYKRNIANGNAKIQVKSTSTIKGILFAYSEELNDDKLYIQLAKDTEVTGQVYSKGSIDAQGAVYGGIMCKTTLLKTNTSINENYLLNATIDVSKRSRHYTGSNLLPAKNKKRIIKYL